MEKFGGSTTDNLEEGHRLAMELFPDPMQYDPKFLQTTLVRKSLLGCGPGSSGAQRNCPFQNPAKTARFLGVDAGVSAASNRRVL